MDANELKKLVGYAAVDEYVKSGMKVGFGTGSTAVWAVRRAGELLRQGKIKDIVGVPTSTQTILECQAAGIQLRTMNDPDIGGELDVAIDGADEVDEGHRLTKGGGGALLIEKIVEYSSKLFIVVVDESKLVKDLGLTFAIPTEVLRDARVPAMRAFGALGATPEVRMAVRKMGPVITDNGNILIDLTFKAPMDSAAMEEKLSLIPGVLGNGIFARCRKPVVMVGRKDGRVEKLSR
jgi:ribose 5-phosphate isomerase A